MMFCGDKKNQVEENVPVVDEGKQVFDVTCAACHGATGIGDGVGAAALNPKPRNFKTDKFKKGDLESVKKTIKEGINGTAMTAWGHLGDSKIEAVAKYVLKLRSEK